MYEIYINSYNSNTVVELAKNNRKFAKFLMVRGRRSARPATFVSDITRVCAH